MLTCRSQVLNTIGEDFDAWKEERKLVFKNVRFETVARGLFP
jgi:hypothetical protein